MYKNPEEITFLSIKNKIFFLFLFICCNLSIGCANQSKNFNPEKTSKEIFEIQRTLKKQEELLVRLQALIADQILHSNDLEQSIPPRDLLESLQNLSLELKNKTNSLEKQLMLMTKELEEFQIKKSKIKTFETDLEGDQMKITLGLISLQAGNPDNAKEYFNDIIFDGEKTKIKGEILMAIGHSFFHHGYTKQAASHYGTFIQEFPKSPRLPQALYYLGKALEKLGQKNKKEVLWNDLILKFPNSNFSKRAKKMMLKTNESKK